MKENITLTFPSGEFTHTELAVANGKTNQQVWTAYQKAITDGVIVSAGNRPNPTGKGKPSKIWKVADGQPVPIVKLTPVPIVKVEPAKPADKPFEIEMGTPAQPPVMETIVEELPVVLPTVAPVEVAEVVEVIQPVVRNLACNLTCQVVEIEETCPFCKTKLLSVNTGDGIKVWCPVNDLKICTCSENPYGVSNNVKNAVEILHDKFFKHRVPTKA